MNLNEDVCIYYGEMLTTVMRKTFDDRYTGPGVIENFQAAAFHGDGRLHK